MKTETEELKKVKEAVVIGLLLLTFIVCLWLYIDWSIAQAVWAEHYFTIQEISEKFGERNP